MVKTGDAFAPLTKEDIKERKQLKVNPNKGELRTYPLLDHFANTWEGILVYSLPGIITTILLIYRTNISSWGAFWDSTFLNFSWVISFMLLIPFTLSALKYWWIWFRSIRIQDNYDTTPGIIAKIGVPGQGKSSTSNYECVLIAKKAWNLLKVEYANWLYKIKKKKTLTPDEEKEWLEVKWSYEYCVNSPYIPLLFTIVPVKVGKRYSNKLTLAHLRGKKRLPLHAVCFCDEASRVIDAGKSLQQGDKKDWGLSNTMALERHYGLYKLYFASQDDNIHIDVCRCSLYTEIMNKQTPSCKPFWLTALKTFYFWLLVELNRKKVRSWGFLLVQYNFIKDLWKRVGYRRYIVSRRANRTGTNTYYNQLKDGKTIIGKSRNYAVYLPAKLNCEYDDRAFRELNDAEFFDYVNAEGWDYLRLKPEDSFLQQSKTEFERQFEKKRIEQQVKMALVESRKKKNDKKSGQKK